MNDEYCCWNVSMNEEVLEAEFRRLEKEIAWLDGIMRYAVGDKTVDDLSATETQVIFNLSQVMGELKEEFASVIDQIQGLNKA